MIKLQNSIVAFAGAHNLGAYEMFVDYWNHAQSRAGKQNYEYQKRNKDGVKITFDEKEKQMNEALVKEVIRVAGVTMDGDLPMEAFATNPQLTWAAFAVVGAMIDAILPEAIVGSIGAYTDVRTIGYGDSASFDIESRDLFVVSKAGRAQRTAELQKQYAGQVTIIPENRQVTVSVSLYKVLSGKESLAKFAAKAVRSIEIDLTLDAYSTFNTAMAALPNSPANEALRIAGYSQESLVKLAQRVTAWNGGAKAVICGTQAALVNVLPDDANYRYTLDSDYATIGYVKAAFGYDVMVFPQVADWKNPFSLELDDTKIYLLSPSSQKLVKMVLEGSTISHVSGAFDAANLSQEATFMKSYGSAIATNSVAGVITLA